MVEKNIYINNSIIYAFKILECFNENNPSYSAKKLSEKLNMNPSSIWKLIYTLEKLDYIKKLENGRYCLGLKHLNFSRVIINNSNIRKICRPFLEDLSRKTSLNVSLGILDQKDVIYLDRIPSPNIPDVYFHIGRRVPLYCTGMGKVLLAFKLNNFQDKVIINIDLKKFTKNTIKDKDLLKKELKKIKENGYAIDNGEFIDSVRCLAMPIHNQDGEVIASVSISDRYLINQEEKNIIENVKELSYSVKKISNALGYSLFNPR